MVVFPNKVFVVASQFVVATIVVEVVIRGRLFNVTYPLAIAVGVCYVVTVGIPVTTIRISNTTSRVIVVVVIAVVIAVVIVVAIVVTIVIDVAIVPIVVARITVVVVAVVPVIVASIVTSVIATRAVVAIRVVPRTSRRNI